ncbi:hybrid sensor histidine kinase/response regulator [Saccharicrinis sp. 156]|uniref:hybrid sensor histidine kinase/response regulator n=1 Tax=Saccharicrinis sp. 156 TaxID=3417574 RepID=UPI003D332EBC
MTHYNRSVLLYLLFLAATFFVQSLGFSQTNTSSDFIRIKHLKNQPQNDVNHIYQDKHGYMWIGTLDGLHRFDGYSYKTYRTNEGKNSISSNLIKSIDEDSLGNIWIGTYDKGISKFNPLTETFTNFYNTPDNIIFNSNDVTTLIVDNNNIIWSANMLGINRIQMNAAMNKIIKVDIIDNNTRLQSDFVNNIKCLHQDKDENIWIGTNLHLYCINNPNAPVQHFDFKQYELNVESICDGPNGIIVGAFYSISEASVNNENIIINQISSLRGSTVLYHSNKVWVGNRSGLYLLEKDNERWNETLFFNENFTDNSLSCNLVTWLSADINGQVWVGTRGGGVNIAAEQNKRFEHYKHTLTSGSISNNLCRSVFEDHKQNLWIGTEEQGISYLPKNADYADGFRQMNVNENLNANRAYCIEETFLPNSDKHNSLIWVGTSYPTSLVVFDGETLQTKPRPQFFDEFGFVFALEATNDSTIWVGTYSAGLFRVNFNKDGEVTQYKNMIPDDGNPNAISSFIVRSILQDSNGNIWVGTDKGINKLSKEQAASEVPQFEIYSQDSKLGSIPHDYVLQIYEAKDGTIWCGTMGGGLLKYNTPLGDEQVSFTNYTTENRLPNNTIKSITEDESGYLWLTSNKGLSRFNPRSDEVINYDITDGLQDNEFSEICSVIRKNGQIVLGGIKGFNVFYPSDIKSDNEKPHMYLTELLIKNQEVKPGEKSFLERSIQFTDEIKLRFQDNSFSIGFVGLNYNTPQKNNYQYILQGFDEQWYKASAETRIAKYTNVPPGEYIFKVLGSNSDNVWSDQPASVKITIAPPFYQSTQAFILYFLIIIGFILLQRYLSVQKNKRKNELVFANMEKDKAEEMSQMKLRFFTNISHEFRTPLTLISAPLDKLIKNNNSSSSEERLTLFNLMNQNIKIMMRLINQLMDFRKLEQEKLSLKVRNINLSEFVKTIYNSFSELAVQKQIDYQLKLKETALMIWADPEKLERIIYNLLANAFKYSPNGGSIEVGVLGEPEKASIYIKDTGIGIKREAQAHIFERYFRDRSQLQQNVGGTGIGLALTKAMVELHHGSISFESEENTGSTFTVALPLGKAHYKTEEIEEGEFQYQFNSPSTGANAIPDIEENTIKSPEIKPKVMVVEDNHDLRMFVVQSLKDEFEILEAEDGQIALNICEENMPDLIVSDIMMPNIDGIELCKTIKTSESTSHIPVILLTAKNTVESQIEGYETGADGYLNKPFNMDVLKASILSILKNREQLRNKFQKEIEISPNLIANNSTDSKFMDKILAIIEEHLSDSEFTVEKMAEKYGVSRIYLNRKIKALTGETSNQFIRNIRLKHAAELLKQGEMNVSEVTWMVGYNDLKTFRTRFKEKFGVSPSEFANNS